MKSLIIITIGALLACPILHAGDSTNGAPPHPEGGPGGHHHMDFLTDAEKAELKKAHDAAVAANPDLAKEEEAAHEKMKAAHESGAKPSEDDMKANKELRDKMDAAMIKADPAVAPIIEKIKAHHHGPGGPGHDGPPPPPDSGT